MNSASSTSPKNNATTKVLSQEWEETGGDFQLVEVYQRLRRLFPWLLLGGLLGGGLGLLFYKTREPQYQVQAKILIKSDDPSNSMLGGGGSIFQGLGLSKGGVLVDNELEIITTYSLVNQVVRQLDLPVTIQKDQWIRSSKTPYYQPPFHLRVLSYRPEAFLQKNNFEYQIMAGSNGSLRWSSGKKDAKVIPIKWGQILRLPMGTVRIDPPQDPLLAAPVSSQEQETRWDIAITSPELATERYVKQIESAIPDKNTDIINLSLKHPHPIEGKKIVNTLMESYVEEGMKDNNQIGAKTLDFLEDRLGQVSAELREVEGQLQDFKEKNELTDLKEQLGVSLEAMKSNAEKLLDAEVKLQLVTSLEAGLRSSDQILPSNLVPGDASLTSILNQYNLLLAQQQRLAKSATPENPVLQGIQSQIRALRQEILGSVTSSRRAFGGVVDQLRAEVNRDQAQVRQLPRKEREYLEISRQQSIKQELYLFLLKKKEETALTQTSKLSNVRIVDRAYAAVKPVSPNRNALIGIGLVLGLALPLLIDYLIQNLNTRIRTKKELQAQTQIPILGEIGQVKNPDIFEVQANPRSVLSEQFRMLRTNLLFYHYAQGQKARGMVVMVSSSMPGEGKTFVSMNLAATLATSPNVKVVVLSLDLRKPELTNLIGFRNQMGFSDFVIERATQEEVVYPLPKVEQLWVIPSGTLPPNPAELLMSPRTEELFQQLRESFDYIVVDCPPIIVTDYQIISRHVDLSLLVVRPEQTEKNQVQLLDTLYQQKRLPKMHLVVNAFDARRYDTSNSGYYSQYGYYEKGDRQGSFWEKLVGPK